MSYSGPSKNWMIIIKKKKIKILKRKITTYLEVIRFEKLKNLKIKKASRKRIIIIKITFTKSKWERNPINYSKRWNLIRNWWIDRFSKRR